MAEQALVGGDADSRALDLPVGVDKDGLLQAMEGHILSQTELMGTYTR